MQEPNVFQMTGSDMFDSIQHTQGGLNHLIQYLWDKYVEHLKEAVEKMQATARPVVNLEMAKKKAPATHFAKWCADYLKENRVTESFFVDGNLGMRLTNSDTMVICPGIEIRGTMQDSGAVAVTEGKSQNNKNGVVGSDGTLRI